MTWAQKCYIEGNFALKCWSVLSQSSRRKEGLRNNDFPVWSEASSLLGQFWGVPSAQTQGTGGEGGGKSDNKNPGQHGTQEPQLPATASLSIPFLVFGCQFNPTSSRKKVSRQVAKLIFQFGYEFQISCYPYNLLSWLRKAKCFLN